MLSLKQQLYISAIVLLITGCSMYSELNYEVLRPAEYSVPPEIKSVVLVDNSIAFPDTNVNIIRVEDEVVKIDTNKVPDYTSLVLQTVLEELDARKFFDTVYIDTIQYKVLSKRGPVEELSLQQINEICGKFGADAIVSLDAYRYTNVIEVTEVADYEYFSTYDASAINFWRLYNCHTGNVMDVHLQKDTIFWEGEGSSINHSLSGFPSFAEATYSIGEYLASGYIDHLAPHWEEVHRRLFTSGSMNFLNATEWLNKGNWEEAGKIWNYIYKTGSKKAKMKAALNLAVAFERNGKINEAVDWASKAYTVLAQKNSEGNSGFKRYIIDFYRQLSIEKMERKKLEQQLGPLE